MPAKKPTAPPIVVIYGDEPYQKAKALEQTLAALLPPEVDRAMALTEADGSRSEEQGGASLATVMDDLCTLPFLADRRVVVVREADKFITAHRQRLEMYVAAPSPTGTLVLECRSFPANTRLAKAAKAAGGKLIACAKLKARRLVDFVNQQAREHGKQLEPGAAERLVALVGQEQGALAGEVEKLDLYTGDRTTITIADIDALVGLSREEKIFAVMDAAAEGNLAAALRAWEHVRQTDPAAMYRAVGGIAFVLRRWLAAHQMREQGMSPGQIAPKVMMWGRQQILAGLLSRLSARRVRALVGELAELDMKAKLGERSIDSGVQALLVAIAG